MAVYVDDMKAKFGRMVMCHMLADTSAELLEMADKIGVQRKWLQNPGERLEHFDICLKKRALAVAAGAIEITQREAAKITMARLGIKNPLQEPSRTIVYGSMCTWWGELHHVGRNPGSSIPCCPFCRRPLWQISYEDWIGSAAEHAKQVTEYDYQAYIRWCRGKCYPNLETALRAYKIWLDIPQYLRDESPSAGCVPKHPANEL